MITNAYFLDENPPTAIKECIESFNESFFKLFPGSTKGHFWIAGGSLRSYFLNEIPRDIDIYADDPGILSMVKNFLTIKGATSLKITDRSEEFILDGIIYDVITKNYANAEQTLQNFDLSPTLCATDGEALYCSQDYFINMATKTLTINNDIDAGNLLERVLHYSRYGFIMPKSETHKIMEYAIKHYINSEEETIVSPASTQFNSAVAKQRPNFSNTFKGLKRPDDVEVGQPTHSKNTIDQLTIDKEDTPF